MRKIEIYDATLREGSQSASSSLRMKDMLTVAKQLGKLNVDVIEAGFPVSSEKEFYAVKEIAEKIEKPIAVLVRAKKEDIKKSWEAIKNAYKPRFHVFVASSPDHRENKLQKSKEEVKEMVKRNVNYALSLGAEVEFTAEDGTRTEKDFLFTLYETASKEGTPFLCLADTVGYAVPNQFASLVAELKKFNKKVSVHCHDDLGLAVANSLAAISAGADEVHCTVNGIGERAGNASLEEIVVALQVRKDFFDTYCNINMKEIYNTSKIVSEKFQVPIPMYKAVVGENATKHEAGIHVHYVKGYEVFDPEKIGRERTIILGQHSGLHTIYELARECNTKVSEKEARKMLDYIEEKEIKIEKENFQKFLEFIKQK